MKATQKMPGAERQSGIALIMILIILLLLVLIMLTSMSTTLLEEQMAGNLRQKNIAFQAAESALREAEQAIEFPDVLIDWDGDGAVDVSPFHPLKFSNGPFQAATDPICSNGLCGGDEQSEEIFTLSDAEIRTASTGIPNIYREPQYIIEMITRNPYEIPDFGDSGRAYAVFRITTRAWGEDPNSFVVLQSMYKSHSLSFSF